MKVDVRVKDRIEKMTAGYNKIALYGIGNATKAIWPCFEELKMQDRIICFVDRDDSRMIGSVFYGFPICKLANVIDEIDLVFVCSEVYWKEIEERIRLFCEEEDKEIPVLSFYNFAPKALRINSDEDYVKYVKYLEEYNVNKTKDFVNYSESDFVRTEQDTKLIAWYLPQYYQMEVNDRFHGKGFTEWTCSSQGMPLFVGHEQPHIPYDVGYYDLNNIDTMRRQIELAKHYGIYGFCFHYYWFSGIRTMEKPVNMFLENKELDIPFCLNWATENWTSVWDGGNYNLIYEQKIEDGDADRFFDDILPFFEDPRYIRIDGAPLFVVYTAVMFSKEEFSELMAHFRKRAKAAGFPDLYILLSNYRAFDGNAEDYNINGIVEFPPTYMGDCKRYDINGYINPYFGGEIYDLVSFVEEGRHLTKWDNANYYRSALVSFDNTVRKPRWGGCVFYGASPKLYKKWLGDILAENKKLKTKTTNLAFVNSWNEWAEGSHLEPDQRHGYAYLQATKEALYEARAIDTEYIDRVIDENNLGENPDIYVLCIESMGDIVACEPIARYLKNTYKNCKITWVIRTCYIDIIKFNPYIDNIMEVDCLGDVIDFIEASKNTNRIIVDCHYDGRTCGKTDRTLSNPVNPAVNESTYFNYGSILESFCLSAGLKPIDDAPIFHTDNLIKIEVPSRYIVIHCKSAERCKDWQAKNWNCIVEKAISMGFDVVEIGLEPIVQVKNSKYHDWTYIREFQKIAYVIEKSYAFMSVDSGFAHIANCFKKKAIILIGAYKNFDKPMPYTGWLRENYEKYIIYAEEGSVVKISIDEVENRMKELFSE